MVEILSFKTLDNRVVRLLLKNKMIVLAWWDRVALSWKTHPKNDVILAQDVVGFTEIGYKFPDE